MANSSHALAHKIFILDAELQKPLASENRRKIVENLVKDLLSTLDMKELGPLSFYDATDLDFPGWSFVQPITTSHITGHYFFEEKTGKADIHIDIYSCKEFEWEDVVPMLHKHLFLDTWIGNSLIRSIDPNSRNAIQISGNGATKLR